ncbi:MAG: prephenate dehydratase [Candidatus Aminicenantes bacterium]|nr:prephenate dehydratase [Candidatus Aminicenantes bacterium]
MKAQKNKNFNINKIKEASIIKIAFQGERGSFSEIVSNKLFEKSILFPCKTFKQVFSKINSNEVDMGVVPVENSIVGRIRESTSLLLDSGLQIINEAMLKIVHCLISKDNMRLENITRVYGHPEALAQCNNFLETLNSEIVSWHDGAGAAKIIKKEKKSALVASKRVAALHNLYILKESIQDSTDNTTRFFVLSKDKTSSTGNDKTTLAFITDHQPGALLRALKPIADNNINMTRLESMPLKGKSWQYMFLIDFVGHQKDPHIVKMLLELKERNSVVKILGSYPTGKYFD